MPKRFCQCTSCAYCHNQAGTHGALFDLDLTGTLKCPGCQGIATARRNARPSSSERGLGWKFSKRKQDDAGYQAATLCHWCKQPFTTADPKTADHLTPRVQGGGDGPIVAAHRSCNSRRGGRLAHGDGQ